MKAVFFLLSVVTLTQGFRLDQDFPFLSGVDNNGFPISVQPVFQQMMFSPDSTVSVQIFAQDAGDLRSMLHFVEQAVEELDRLTATDLFYPPRLRQVQSPRHHGLCLHACKPDIAMLCAPGVRPVPCLRSKQSQLSPACKEVIDRIDEHMESDKQHLEEKYQANVVNTVPVSHMDEIVKVPASARKRPMTFQEAQRRAAELLAQKKDYFVLFGAATVAALITFHLLRVTRRESAPDYSEHGYEPMKN